MAEQQTQSNSFNADKLSGYLTEIFRHDDELDRLTGEHLNACRGPRSQIREILTAAREAGVNMVAFRQVLAEARDDRRHAKRVAAMEQIDANDYDRMSIALGDFATTPLGQAAMQRAAE